MSDADDKLIWWRHGAEQVWRSLLAQAVQQLRQGAGDDPTEWTFERGAILDAALELCCEVGVEPRGLSIEQMIRKSKRALVLRRTAYGKGVAP